MYRIVPISLSHVDVRAKAHHLYTLQILRCISSTTLITIDKIKYNTWMCNGAHRGSACFARFSAHGRKSSRQRCRVATRVRVEGRDHGGHEPGRDGGREADPLWSDCVGCGMNQMIPGACRELFNTREERERFDAPLLCTGNKKREIRTNNHRDKELR